MPTSSFVRHQPLSTDKDTSAAVFAGNPNSRFKYDSLDKEVVKKNFGTETKHIGYYDGYVSTMAAKQPLSGDATPSIALFGGGQDDRFKYDSLPKEIISKNFGTETRNLGFFNMPSTMIPKQPLSTDNSSSVAVMGPGFSNPESQAANRFKLDSSTANNSFGSETQHLGFHVGHESTLRQNTFAFGKIPDVKKFNTNNEVNNDILWRHHVAGEIRDRINAGQYDHSPEVLAAHREGAEARFGANKVPLAAMISMIQEKIGSKSCSINSMSLAAFKLFGCKPSRGANFSSNDGGITKEMWSSTLGDWGFGLSEKELHVLFKYFDRTGAGLIKFSDFVQTVQPTDYPKDPWYYQREKAIYDEQRAEEARRRGSNAHMADEPNAHMADGTRAPPANADRPKTMSVKKPPAIGSAAAAAAASVTASEVVPVTPSQRLATPASVLAGQGRSKAPGSLPLGLGTPQGRGSTGQGRVGTGQGRVGTGQGRVGTGARGKTAVRTRTGGRVGTGARMGTGARGRTGVGTAASRGGDGSQAGSKGGGSGSSGTLGMLQPTATAAPKVHLMKITQMSDGEEGKYRAGSGMGALPQPLPPGHMSKSPKNKSPSKRVEGASRVTSGSREGQPKGSRRAARARDDGVQGGSGSTPDSGDVVGANRSGSGDVPALEIGSSGSREDGGSSSTGGGGGGGGVSFTADTAEHTLQAQAEFDEEEVLQLQVQLQLEVSRAKKKALVDDWQEKGKVAPWNRCDTAESESDTNRSGPLRRLPGDFMGSARWEHMSSSGDPPMSLTF
jgi:hypothetical protein